MLRSALLAVLFAAATLTVTAAPAQARVCALGSYCVTTYYSDSSHTTVVGVLTEDCDGNASRWGARSSYKDFTETPC
jgi:hypothetical protein